MLISGAEELKKQRGQTGKKGRILNKKVQILRKKAKISKKKGKLMQKKVNFSCSGGGICPPGLAPLMLIVEIHRIFASLFGNTSSAISASDIDNSAIKVVGERSNFFPANVNFVAKNCCPAATPLY